MGKTIKEDAMSSIDKCKRQIREHERKIEFYKKKILHERRIIKWYNKKGK